MPDRCLDPDRNSMGRFPASDAFVRRRLRVEEDWQDAAEEALPEGGSRVYTHKRSQT